MILDPTLNNKYKVFWERYREYITKAVCNSFKELKDFK
jgi:hypothetical protein